MLVLSQVSLLILPNLISPGVFAKLCDIGSGKSVEAGISFEKGCLAKCTCDPSGSGEYNCDTLCPSFGVAHPCRKVRPYQQCCKRSICPDNEQLESCDPFSSKVAKNLTTVPWQLRLMNGERSCNGIILSERHLYAKSDCLLSHNNSLKILDQWTFVRSVQPIDGRFNGLAKLELNRSINFTPKIHEINAPPSEFCDKYANFNVSNCGLLVAVYTTSSEILPAATDRLLSARISRSENCFPSDAAETAHTMKCLELEEETSCQVLEWSSVSLKIGDLFYLVGVTVVNETCGEDSVAKAKFVSFMDVCDVVSDQFMFNV